MLYVPILRGKLGEFRGIEQLSEEVKSEVFPLFRITDPDLDYEEEPASWKISHQAHFSKIAVYLEKYCSTEIAVFIDFEVDPDTTIKGKHYSEWMFRELNGRSLNYTPVLSLDRKDEPGYLDSIKDFGMKGNSSVCIRIPKDYVESISLHVEDIQEIVKRLDIKGDTFFLFDLEQIDEASSVKPLVEIALNVIQKEFKYHSLIVASACMPETMSEFESNNVTPLSRCEWELWKSLRKKTPVVYSDYGVLSTSNQSINPKMMTRSCRIRYSTESEIVVFKGESEKKTKSRIQNPQLARKVLKHGSYKGTKFSWGDKYIRDCASGDGGPGNATTWISAEMNHHITLVYEQVSNFLYL